MRTPLRTALLVALAVVGIVTVVPAHAESSPSAFGSRLVTLINNARAQHGLRTLTVTSGTSTVAANWTEHLASAGALSHNPNLGPQLESHGSPNWTTYGENVGEGPTSSADTLFNAYMNSPEHRDNILGSRYRYLGIGVVFSGSTAWNTLDFVDQYSSGQSSSSNSTTSSASPSSRPASPRVTHHAATRAPAASRPAARATHRTVAVAQHFVTHPAAVRPVAAPKRVHVPAVRPVKPATAPAASAAAAPAAPVAAARVTATLPGPLSAPSPRPMRPVLIAIALLALLASTFGRTLLTRGA